MIGLINRIKLIVRRMPFVDYIYDLVNALLTLQETGGTLTATGGEDTLYIEATPLGVFKPRWLTINLDNMAVGDGIIVRLYHQQNATGARELYDYQEYRGADGGLLNSKKVIAISLMDNRHGFEVTLEQDMLGALRDFEWELTEEA